MDKSNRAQGQHERAHKYKVTQHGKDAAGCEDGVRTVYNNTVCCNTYSTNRHKSNKPGPGGRRCHELKELWKAQGGVFSREHAHRSSTRFVSVSCIDAQHVIHQSCASIIAPQKV
jgi:hypothetical protein